MKNLAAEKHRPFTDLKIPLAVIFTLVLALGAFCTSLHAQDKAIESLRETGKAFASVAKKVSPAGGTRQVSRAFLLTTGAGWIEI